MTITAMFDQPVTWEQVLDHLNRYLMDHGEQRLGQAYFNALFEIYPEVANLVRGTVADPFHSDSYDDRVSRFYETIRPYFA